jgi:lipooligosaccharide transport system permease protein
MRVCAVVELWLRAWRRTWRGSLSTSFLSPLLYLAAMGYGLGALVERGVGTVEGVGYVTFIAPGVLAASTMQSAVAETTWPIMDQLRWRRHFEAVIATPVRPVEVVLGTLGYLALRLTMMAVVFLVVAAALATVTSWWGVLAVPASVLTGLAFAAPTLAFSAVLRNESGYNVLFRVGIVPMFLFSGTFFPITLLPDGLLPVAWVTPLWHGVDLCRSLTLGRPEALAVLGHVGYLCAWVLGGTAAAGWLLRRRMIV